MPERAGVLVGILGKDKLNIPIIFSDHINTVHIIGLFGKNNRTGYRRACGKRVNKRRILRELLFFLPLAAI